MAYGYLVLAMILAATLNSGDRIVRPAGTTLMAIGLVMIAVSIVLANLDGAFDGYAARASGLADWTPAFLNLQAALALTAVPFLVWTVWIAALDGCKPESLQRHNQLLSDLAVCALDDGDPDSESDPGSSSRSCQRRRPSGRCFWRPTNRLA